MGAAVFAVGEGWMMYGVVPIRWLGVVAMVLGGLMVAYPARYRELSARAKGR